MANNYYDATGTLTLKRVTPVIEALFSAMSLDASFPGGQEVYIAELSEETCLDWDSIAENLQDLCDKRSLDRRVPAEGEWEMMPILEALASDMETPVDSEQLVALSKSLDLDYSASPRDLFRIAQMLDDGHGLQRLAMQGAWTCSKPRLFEFGGNATVITPMLTASTDTGNRMDLFVNLSVALEKSNFSEVADRVLQDVSALLNSITDPLAKKMVMKSLERKMPEFFATRPE